MPTTPEEEKDLTEAYYERFQKMLQMQMRAKALQTIEQHQRNKIADTKNILARLKPEAAGRFIRNLKMKQGKITPPSSEVNSQSSASPSSSTTLKSKHPGPSDESSSASTEEVPETNVPQPNSLKRKRTEDDEELDEVADRVKRLKVARKSLWESFDDSQFRMNSGLLYDPKLWEWYW